MTFTKLFSSITASTVWLEPSDTRVVWITMLAMADRRGRVWASVPGLAKEAVVSVESCREALSKFLNPDPDSRTKIADGRRIEEIEGGWRLINHAKYRAIRDEEERRAYKAEKQREYRAVDNVDKCGPPLTTVEPRSHNAEAEAEAEASKTKTPRRAAAPSAESATLYGLYPRKVGKAHALAAIEKALKSRTFDSLLLAVQAFGRKCARDGTEEQFIPHPATWFNQGRFDDEEFTPGYQIQPNGAKQNGHSGKGDANLAVLERVLAENNDGFDSDGDVPTSGDGRFDLKTLLGSSGKRAV